MEIAISSQKHNKLQFNQFMKSDKMLYIIHAYLKFIWAWVLKPYTLLIIWKISIVYNVGKIAWKSFVASYESILQI